MATHRLNLWEEEEVRDLLRPEKMALAQFMEPGSVKRFLKQSQDVDFNHESQWAKVFSMEVALQKLKER